jgi:hypothetical protein
MYLRDACFELAQAQMPFNLHVLPSTWLNFEPPSSVLPVDHIRVLHPSQLDNSVLESTFRGDTENYSTAFVGRVRYTTVHYSNGTVSGDSNIVIKTGSRSNFGRIRRIFQVNKGETLFNVETVSNLSNFQCTESNNHYHYQNIRSGSFSDGTSHIFKTSSRNVFSISAMTNFPPVFDFQTCRRVLELSSHLSLRKLNFSIQSSRLFLGFLFRFRS